MVAAIATMPVALATAPRLLFNSVDVKASLIPIIPMPSTPVAYTKLVKALEDAKLATRARSHVRTNPDTTFRFREGQAIRLGKWALLGPDYAGGSVSSYQLWLGCTARRGLGTYSVISIFLIRCSL
jgi:hypothetical protein